MRLKNGVRAAGVRPELLLALVVTDSLFTECGKELVVTSLTEGQHSETSLHYAGAAFDFRIWEFDEAGLEDFVADLRKSLGQDYDVVIEPTHVHVEYQPRKL